MQNTKNFQLTGPYTNTIPNMKTL
ncbi:hypothetical protein ACJIZ3_023518 [Penstemon smallii]|uniref:Uncharacterized protein n=1 Tax=Penstemon smallii TaxID=265156 RepID=A0ABD3TEI4_9LAMI